jgi:hypothetical protein
MIQIISHLCNSITSLFYSMKKRVGIVIGGDSGNKHIPDAATSNQLNTSISGFCSVDEGVDLLASRMSKLDSRIASIEQGDQAVRSSGKGGRDKSSWGTGGRGSHGKVRHRVMDSEEDSCDSLSLQRSIEELERRVEKHDIAIEKLKRHSRGRSSSRGRQIDSDDDRRSRSRSRSTGAYRHGTDDDLEHVQHQVRSLQKKVKTLGDSTSRACRSLSVGVTDSQNATLQLYSWADKVHSAFGVLSKECLKRPKNICPRAKLADLSNAVEDGFENKNKKRSVSAGAENRSGKGGGNFDVSF